MSSLYIYTVSPQFELAVYNSREGGTIDVRLIALGAQQGGKIEVDVCFELGSTEPHADLSRC